MQTVLIVIHLLIVLALVVVVLLQRSEGGALGMGGGGGGGLMTARGAANALTRTTAILAACFFATSLALAILARYGGTPTNVFDRVPAGQTVPGATEGEGGSLLDQLGGLPDQQQGDAPAAAPAEPETGVPFGATPSAPAEQVPANPAPEAPNASEAPTVPPVEQPAPGSTPQDAAPQGQAQ